MVSYSKADQIAAQVHRLHSNSGSGEMLLYFLFGQLLFGAVSSLNVENSCLKCNNTKEICDKLQSGCQDSELCINSTKLNVQEGDDVTFTCYHNLTSTTATFMWFFGDTQYGEPNKAQNESLSNLVLTKVLTDKRGNYSCTVQNDCCSCKSAALTLDVNGNSLIVMVICGVSALALVVIMGVAMKIKLKRDNAQHRERMKQRVQAEQNRGQTPSPQRGY